MDRTARTCLLRSRSQTQAGIYIRACNARACACLCVRACVRAGVRVCAHAWTATNSRRVLLQLLDCWLKGREAGRRLNWRQCQHTTYLQIRGIALSIGGMRTHIWSCSVELLIWRGGGQSTSCLQTTGRACPYLGWYVWGWTDSVAGHTWHP